MGLIHYVICQLIQSLLFLEVVNKQIITPLLSNSYHFAGSFVNEFRQTRADAHYLCIRLFLLVFWVLCWNNPMYFQTKLNLGSGKLIRPMRQLKEWRKNEILLFFSKLIIHNWSIGLDWHCRLHDSSHFWYKVLWKRGFLFLVQSANNITEHFPVSLIGLYMFAYAYITFYSILRCWLPTEGP